MFPEVLNVMGSNFVFYVMALVVGYSVFSNVQVGVGGMERSLLVEGRC